jgi:citrate lyase beta subunit
MRRIQVQGGDTVDAVCTALDRMGIARDVGVWAMIETPLGVLRAEEISKAGQVCMRACVIVFVSSTYVHV